jgi:hypothetical protein
VLFIFSTYPTSIFRGAAKLALFTVLPAGFIAFVPVEVIRMRLWMWLLVDMAVAAGFVALGTLIFAGGLRRYESGTLFIARTWQTPRPCGPEPHLRAPVAEAKPARSYMSFLTIRELPLSDARHQSSRYTRRAVPLNRASFSSAEAPAAMRLNAFHSAAQLIPIFSTGKLLSNMQRSGPNRSMQVSM